MLSLPSQHIPLRRLAFALLALAMSAGTAAAQTLAPVVRGIAALYGLGRLGFSWFRWHGR